MGNCVRSQKKNQIRNHKTIPAEILCKYPRTGTVKIRYRNYVGKVTNEQIKSFEVTEPAKTLCSSISIHQLKVLMSLCILPGMDTRSAASKSCQDHTFYFFDESSILLCLLDGHGAEGDKVVSFCEGVVQDLYQHHRKLYEVNHI